ncbi:hypothetical protein ACFSCX_06555 [Bacillus salitolerans]|uniref:AAA domain-containing protein n=1 Tax=Bacillus salitolerans TaxID=1437434 RepID=A0ABW4LN84_9BACI
MSTVSFWSPTNGQATTSNLILVASLLSAEYELKTMMTQTHAQSTLESAFLTSSQGSMVDFSDSGIDALERLARSNRLTHDKVANYTKSVLTNRLDLLAGTSKPNFVKSESIHDVLETIIEAAKRYYDLLLIDVNNGTDHELASKVLQKSDLVIVNLTQNVNVLDQFFSKDIEQLQDKKMLLVLSNYDVDSRYSEKNIRRRYHCKSPILTVPYNTDYRDAFNDKKVLEYFLRARKQKAANNHFFVNEVRKLAKEILKLSDIEMNDEIRGVS